MGETSRRLNAGMREQKQRLEHVPKSPVNLKKHENRSAISFHELRTGHKIKFEGTEILQKEFGTHKERLTTEALYLWANKILNIKGSIQLLNPWKTTINK